ncbi:MAG: YhjD/YihY/BrkB family envelope integrity protein [Limisphaerales bacterium]
MKNESSEAGLQFHRLEQFGHFWTLVWKSFVRNRGLIRASALAFSTLLAFIPMLAVTISVTSSLLKSEGPEQIEQFVQKIVNHVIPPATLGANPSSESSPATNQINSATGSISSTNLITAKTFGNSSETNPIAAPPTPGERIAAQKEVAKRIHEFIQNTRSGALGVAGMLVLVFVAIQMIANIEATFNDIWGVTQGRNWLTRVVLYWTAITLGPLLLVAATGLAGGTQLQSAKNFIHHTPIIGGFIFHLLPLVVLWLAFTAFYQFVPNTKVHFRAALIGGIVGGTLWHLNNVFAFLYVSSVVTNSKIYGSLGLIPVFMVGLYFSWAVLLFGAQVAYAFQNRHSYLQEKLVENVNQRGREFVALRLMTCIGRHFQFGRQPITIQEISAELEIPTKLAQQVLCTLLATRLVVETSGTEPAYSPARPLEAINCHHILAAMRAANGQEVATRDEPMRVEVLGEFARIQEAEKDAASALTLLALVDRAQTQLKIAAPEK